VPTGHGGIAAMLSGDVALGDAHHLSIRSAQGGRLLVDLRSGATSRPAPGQILWCAHANFFTIERPLGVGSPQRVGASRYTPCDAAGHAVSGVPSGSVPGVAHSAGMRVWASPTGLEGVRG
jgi:hypothetical protein